MTVTQYKTHKSAQIKLDEIFTVGKDVLFIHYSCESFYDNPNRSSHRITSIAIHLLKNGQTKSFSIHHEAELEKIPTEQIIEHYDKFEQKMLKKFNQFIANHKAYSWVHWNMKNIDYGFEAILHRSKVLKANPKEVADDRKFDLAKILYNLLGPKYIPHGRFQNILEKNKMTPRNYLNGKEEAAAFENGEYIKLHQSTLAKVDVIMHLAKDAAEGRLKCNNSYFKQKGLTLSTASTILKDHPMYTFICILLTVAAAINYIPDIISLIPDNPKTISSGTQPTKSIQTNATQPSQKN